SRSVSFTARWARQCPVLPNTTGALPTELHLRVSRSGRTRTYGLRSRTPDATRTCMYPLAFQLVRSQRAYWGISVAVGFHSAWSPTTVTLAHGSDYNTERKTTQSGWRESNPLCLLPKQV